MGEGRGIVTDKNFMIVLFRFDLDCEDPPIKIRSVGCLECGALYGSTHAQIFGLIFIERGHGH